MGLVRALVAAGSHFCRAGCLGLSRLELPPAGSLADQDAVIIRGIREALDFWTKCRADERCCKEKMCYYNDLSYKRPIKIGHLKSAEVQRDPSRKWICTAPV